MRSSFLGIAAAASALLWVSATAQCDTLSLDQVLDTVACGTEVGLLRCLFDVSDAPELTQVDDLRRCLRGLGCSESESVTGAEWIASDCGNDPVTAQNTILRELKKRATTSSTKASTNTAKTTTSAAITTSASTTPAKTSSTSIASTSSTSSSSASSLSSSTSTASTTSSDSTSTMATTAAPTDTSGPLVCLATSLSSISICSTSTVNGATSSSCTPTTTPIISCAAGLICDTASDNSIVCMKEQNNLTLSGLIVTIVFGVILASLIGSLIVMCFSSRKKSRAAKKARDSVFISSAVRTRPEASEAHLPLMNQQGPAGQGGYEEYGTARPDAHRTPSGTYQDVTAASRNTPPVPKLHPGLMVTAPPGNPFDEEDDVGYGRRR